MNFIVNFLNKNIDQLILIVIGVIIGLLINYFCKIINYPVKKIKKIYRIFKRKIKGEYTFNELIKFGKMPREQLTNRQAKALDKANKDIAEVLSKMDFSGIAGCLKNTLKLHDR